MHACTANLPAPGCATGLPAALAVAGCASGPRRLTPSQRTLQATPPVPPPQAKEEVLERLKASGAFRTEFARVPGSGCVSPADLEHAFTAVLGAVMRRLALEEGWRCDGRGPIDVRPVHCEVRGGRKGGGGGGRGGRAWCAQRRPAAVWAGRCERSGRKQPAWRATD